MDISKKTIASYKGVALLLLLFHHLFYNQDRLNLWDDLNIGLFGHPIFKMAINAKVCVAMFVLVSGYGLQKKYQLQPFTVFKFLKERYTKLLKNYWIIWLLFVPIGIFFFGRTFSEVYTEHIPLRFVCDFFGIYQIAFGWEHGYNPTWWFYSCVISLYAIYPVLRFISRRFGFIYNAILSFVLCAIPISRIYFLSFYIFTFVVGMLIAEYNIQCNVYISAVIALGYILTRHIYDPTFINLFDCIFCVNSLIVVDFVTKKSWRLNNILSFIGKHSSNIFLFHTFIFAYYLPNVIYYTENPLIIFLTLLIICLMISIAIEYCKNKFLNAQIR